jgi:hypothetical protein
MAVVHARKLAIRRRPSWSSSWLPKYQKKKIVTTLQKLMKLANGQVTTRQT